MYIFLYDLNRVAYTSGPPSLSQLNASLVKGFTKTEGTLAPVKNDDILSNKSGLSGFFTFSLLSIVILNPMDNEHGP